MARAKARQAQCAKQLDQIHTAWTLAGAKLPAPLQGAEWPQKLLPHVEQESKIFLCPDNVAASSSSYGMNTRAFRMADQDNGRIAFLDYQAAEARVVGQSIEQLAASWPAEHAPRHFQQQNIAFGDGHVEAKAPHAIDPRFCENYIQYWRPARDGKIELAGCALPGTPPPTTAGGSATGVSSTTGSGGAATGTTAAATTAATTTGTTTGSTSSSGATSSATTAGATTTGTTTSSITTGGSSTSGGSTTGSAPCSVEGRYVRIQLLNSDFLHMAEVQVFDTASVNVAQGRSATQSQTAHPAVAARAVDGNTDGNFNNNSVNHTQGAAPWWEVDLGSLQQIARIHVFNRTDCCLERINGATVKILDAGRATVWSSNLYSVGTDRELMVCGSTTTPSTGPAVTSCGDDAPSGFVSGLRSQWWNYVPSHGNAFTTPPFATRIDSKINFPYGTYPSGRADYRDSYNGNMLNYPSQFPPGLAHPYYFAARWRGELRADVTGSHQFWLKWDDGTTIKIDHTTIRDAIGNYTAQYDMAAPEPMGPPLNFEAGHWYCVDIKHGNHGWPAWLQLLWQPPGKTAPEPIPPQNLRAPAP
jgi:hypothetical protein